MLCGDQVGSDTVKTHGAFVVRRIKRAKKGVGDGKEWKVFDIGVTALMLKK